MIESLLARIRPRRPQSVEEALGAYLRHALQSADEQASISRPGQSQATGESAAAEPSVSGEFQAFLEQMQGDLVEAVREFTGDVEAPLSRTISEDLAVPSRPEHRRSRSTGVVDIISRAAPTMSTPGTPVPSTPTTGISTTLPGPDEVTSSSSSSTIPSFHPQPGQIRSNDVASGGSEGRPRSLNFFRVHIFPAARPSASNTGEDPNAPPSPNDIVPCIFLGVRSITHDPAASPDELLEHPHYPFGNERAQATANSGVPNPTARTDTGLDAASDQQTPSSSTSTLGSLTSTTSREPDRTRRSLRARLLALSPFSPSSTSPAAAARTPTPPRSPPVSTYLVYVIGGHYPRSHPILSIPALVTGEPLSDEEMTLIGELLGQAKPPTASRDEVDKSGLRVFEAGELGGMVERGEVLEGCAERCLVSGLHLLLMHPLDFPYMSLYIYSLPLLS